MRTVKTLIQEISEQMGSDAELARRLGLQRQDVYALKTGRRSTTPEMLARLCNLVDMPCAEAREWLALVVLENRHNSTDDLISMTQAYIGRFKAVRAKSPRRVARSDEHANKKRAAPKAPA